MTRPTGQLSPHIAWTEVLCRCGCVPSEGVVANLQRLGPSLEAFRAEINRMYPLPMGKVRPLNFHCAHRCAAQNAKVNGAPASQHMSGNAADIDANTDSSRLSAWQLQQAAFQVPAFAHGGIGLYDWGIHVDQRPGGPSRWDLRAGQK